MRKLSWSNDEIELLNATVTSLENLQSIDMSMAPDDQLQGMLRHLAKQTSTLKLTYLRLFYGSWAGPSYDTNLPGMDTFLASAAASKLKDLFYSSDSCCALALKRMTSGLAKNPSVESWSVGANKSITEEATKMLPRFIRKAPKNLKKLIILSEEQQSSYFQETVLSALCANTSITDLVFDGGFNNDAE